MKKELIAEGIQRIDEPEINRKIVLLFLEKVELLTPEERKTIIKTIQILNCPTFIMGTPLTN